jgi:hypothetical protein
MMIKGKFIKLNLDISYSWHDIFFPQFTSHWWFS